MDAENLDAEPTYDVEEAKKNVAAIAQFSKNFIPTLFNIFGPAPEDQKVFIHKTIGDYISITDAKVDLSL